MDLPQVLTRGSHTRTGEGDVSMPPFGAKRSSLTPADVATACGLD